MFVSSSVPYYLSVSSCFPFLLLCVFFSGLFCVLSVAIVNVIREYIVVSFDIFLVSFPFELFRVSFFLLCIHSTLLLETGRNMTRQHVQHTLCHRIQHILFFSVSTLGVTDTLMSFYAQSLLALFSSCFITCIHSFALTITLFVCLHSIAFNRLALTRV